MSRLTAAFAPALAMDAFTMPCGRTAGTATVGRTGPPSTWCTVLTATPCERSPASQRTKAVNVASRMDSTPQADGQTWWNTSGSQPPPARCTRSTDCSRSASVVVESTWPGVRTANGSAGGMVSASAQPGQPGAARPVAIRAAS